MKTRYINDGEQEVFYVIEAKTKGKWGYYHTFKSLEHHPQNSLSRSLPFVKDFIKERANWNGSNFRLKKSIRQRVTRIKEELVKL